MSSLRFPCLSSLLNLQNREAPCKLWSYLLCMHVIERLCTPFNIRLSHTQEMQVSIHYAPQRLRCMQLDSNSTLHMNVPLSSCLICFINHDHYVDMQLLKIDRVQRNFETKLYSCFFSRSFKLAKSVHTAQLRCGVSVMGSRLMPN